VIAGCANASCAAARTSIGGNQLVPRVTAQRPALAHALGQIGIDGRTRLQRREIMSSNLNNCNVTQLNDAELECVSGGAEATTRVLSPAEQAGQQLSAIYLKNHPVILGSFPPPHVAVPRIG